MLCPLHSICIDLFTQITPRTLLGFHYRYSFLWPPRARLAFNKSSLAPFLMHALCVCVCVFYEWSLSSLDRDGFQSLKSKKRWGWILNHFPLKWGAILWRGLGDSISKHLRPTYVITFPLVEIKAAKQFWRCLHHSY